MKASAHVGTSGWNYDSWREVFYQGRPRKEWLRFCAQRFSAIEVNATFYRLQSKETFERWRAASSAAAWGISSRSVSTSASAAMDSPLIWFQLR